MSSYVTNIITNDFDFKPYLNKINGGDYIDFNKIIPMPDSIKETDEYPNPANIWRENNWGTKYCGYDCSFDDKGNLLKFETVSTPPILICEKLSIITGKKIEIIVISEETSEIKLMVTENGNTSFYLLCEQAFISDKDIMFLDYKSIKNTEGSWSEVLPFLKEDIWYKKRYNLVFNNEQYKSCEYSERLYKYGTRVLNKEYTKLILDCINSEWQDNYDIYKMLLDDLI